MVCTYRGNKNVQLRLCMSEGESQISDNHSYTSQLHNLQYGYLKDNKNANMYWKSNHFPPNEKKLKRSQGLKLKLCSRVLQYLLGTSRLA